MSLPKLFSKCFPFLLKGGLDADIPKFQQQAAAGEIERTTDTNRVFIATSTADDTADAVIVELATLKGNTPITAASPTLDMTFNNKNIEVDTSSNTIDFQVADDELTAGFRCVLLVNDATNNVSVTRSGSTATINGGTTKSYTTPAVGTHILISCGVDNKLHVAKIDP